jgi:hypothetical protein
VPRRRSRIAITVGVWSAAPTAAVAHVLTVAFEVSCTVSRGCRQYVAPVRRAWVSNAAGMSPSSSSPSSGFRGFKRHP